MKASTVAQDAHGERTQPMVDPIVSVEGLRMSFRRERLASRHCDVSFSVRPRETVALVGESGSSKSDHVAVDHAAAAAKRQVEGA